MTKINIAIGENKIYVLPLTHKDPPSRPPLLFVHMSWGGLWAFKMYMRFFFEHGFDCYALDLRGHGISGGSVAGATMKDYVSDVREVVKYYKLKSPFIIGHSMGGLVALMYGASHTASGIVSIDGSPTAEVQGEGRNVQYPAEYTPADAGMPSEPESVMQVFPDLQSEQLKNLKGMLKTESGVARSERKRGVSIPKDSLSIPLLFVGAELGTSVPFGIGIEKSNMMAGYYSAYSLEIKGASHPGILMGSHWKDAAEKINKWLLANI